jgi:transitional endoplasmic reticulum ATPase
VAVKDGYALTYQVMNVPGISLKVAEAFQNDISRGIARIDSKAKSELGVSTGDIIRLSGKKAALAIVWQAHPDDEGLEMIRLDGILRQNVGVGLGEKVKIEPVQTRVAKKIVLAPQEPVRYSVGFDQYVKKRLVGKPVLKGNLLPVGIFGTSVPLVVVQVFPQGPVMITEETEIRMQKEPAKEMAAVPNITYDDVGGLKDAIQKVREMIELPLRHPEIFERLGIDPPKGVLLYGAPGTGKTLLAKAVANESDANFFYVGGPEIISKYVGESEERLRKLFAEAQENSPSIIFIDEVDAIAPKREEVMGEVEKRMVSQLLTTMDGLKARGEVIVIAATNRPDSIDPALRRPGRFDREIEIGVPDKADRAEILGIHVRNMPLTADVNVAEIASITHGYTGADLSLLTKEAAIKALRRVLPMINIEDETLPQEILERIQVSRDDFFSGMHEIRPSALREVFVEKPSVKWDDIGGLDELKRELKEAVELPLKKPEIFEKMGIRPIKGILLYGPPGTGKTLLAKAVATETEANFISMKGADLVHPHVGESAKLTKEMFRKARMAAPCVLFIDEIESIARSRASNDASVIHEDIVNCILVEMDGLSSLKNVIVIAATNRPDIVDPALMRPGRFDRLIEVVPPDEKARLQIFKICTARMPLDKDINLKDLSKITEGYTGADIDNLVREAGMTAIREDAKKVATRHFELSFKMIVPSIKKEHVESVQKFKAATATMYR